MTYDYCETADRKESDGSQFFTQFFMSSQTRQIILGIAEPTQHQWSWWSFFLMDGKGHHPHASNSSPQDRGQSLAEIQWPKIQHKLY